MACEQEAQLVAEARANVASAKSYMDAACNGARSDDPNCLSAMAAYESAQAVLSRAESNLSACLTAPRIGAAAGLVEFLRVHELGSGWGGGGSNPIDAEVIFKLDTEPRKAFGIPLRSGDTLPAHEAMYSLVRDAFVGDLRLHIEFLEVPTPPNQNSLVIRAWIEKRHSSGDANLVSAGVDITPGQ